MLYEIKGINPFPQVQGISSCCRLITCVKESHGKKFGASGKKISNAHLRWAFSLAAQLFLKSNEPGRQLYIKLTSKHGKGKSLSILAQKPGGTVCFMLTNRETFNMSKFLAV
jgi:transposase